MVSLISFMVRQSYPMYDTRIFLVRNGRRVKSYIHHYVASCTFNFKFSDYFVSCNIMWSMWLQCRSHVCTTITQQKWYDDMKTFSALLAPCVRGITHHHWIPRIKGRYLNLEKQSTFRSFETPWHPYHCNKAVWFHVLLEVQDLLKRYTGNP